jgi:hypothetical protein
MSISKALNYNNRFDLFLPTSSNNSIFKDGINFLALVRKYPLLWSWLLDLTVPESMEQQITTQANNTYGIPNNLIKPHPDNTVVTGQNNNPQWNMENVLKFLKHKGQIPEKSPDDFFSNVYKQHIIHQQKIRDLTQQNYKLSQQVAKFQDKVIVGNNQFMTVIDPSKDKGFGIEANTSRSYDYITSDLLWENQNTQSQNANQVENTWNSFNYLTTL